MVDDAARDPIDKQDDAETIDDDRSREEAAGEHESEDDEQRDYEQADGDQDDDWDDEEWDDDDQDDDWDHEEAAEDVEPVSLWRRTRRLRRVLVVLLLLFLAVIGGAVLNNNVSFSGKTRAEFEEELDSGLEASIEWVTRQQVYLAGRESNPMLLFMIRDMHETAANPEFANMLKIFMRTHPNPANIWRRMVDPQAEVADIDREAIDVQSDYQRWFAYAMSPEDYPLTEEDHASMLDPHRHRRGSLTHQLLALLLIQDQGRADENVETLMNILCERIAFEAAVDIRVTDLYLQRVECLLAAGRPDLVKRRWIERILGYQQPDGGFMDSWHGWGPGVFRLHFDYEKPIPHATIQGVWVLYLIKHRYPEWVEEHYPS